MIAVDRVALYWKEDPMQPSRPVPLSSLPALLALPQCKQCDTRMYLTRAVPDEKGYDLRSYECPACGSEQDLKIKIP